MAEDVISESRMRAALQSRTNDIHVPRGRHRYVQDGEIPVVVLNSRPRQIRDRLAMAEMEQALASERAARGAAEAALKEGEETIRRLQTSLALAEAAQHATDLKAAEPVSEVTPDQTAPPRKPRSKRAKPTTAEEKPVDWWSPGWKERLRKAG